MKYATLRDLIKARLPLVTPATPTKWDKVFYWPGPQEPDQPVDLMCMLTRDGGLGLQLDGVLDNVSYQVMTAGSQNLFEQAEALADDIDTALIGLPTGTYAGKRVVSVVRVGGPPQALVVDNADRTQFVCSYFFDVESTLVPN